MDLIEKLKAQIEQLDKAVNSLKEAVESSPSRMNMDATIQRFEYTFEISWKLMQSVAREKGTEIYNPRDAIREGARNGLIDDPQEWFNYLKARNSSTHIYHEELANDVYETAKKFFPAVVELRRRLEL